MIELHGRDTISYEDNSKKSLVVIFIVAVLITNGGLIALRLKQHGRLIFTRANTLIQLSLAVGSIVHALFADVIFAVILFAAARVDCSLFVLASNLKENFIPFVYACGLVLLSLESIFRSHAAFCIKSRLNHKLTRYSIISCAILPWFLGVVISCPLTLHRVDFENSCDFKQSVTEEFVVQCIIGILPSVCCICASSMAWLLQEFNPNEDFQQRIDIYLRQRGELETNYAPQSESRHPSTDISALHLQLQETNNSQNNPGSFAQQHQQQKQQQQQCQQATDDHGDGGGESGNHYCEIGDADNYYSPMREYENIDESQITESGSQTEASRVPSLLTDTGSRKEQDSNFPFDSPCLLIACTVFIFGTLSYHVFQLYILGNNRRPVEGSSSLEYNLDVYESVIDLWFYWLLTEMYHVIIPVLWIVSRDVNIFFYKCW